MLQSQAWSENKREAKLKMDRLNDLLIADIKKMMPGFAVGCVEGVAAYLSRVIAEVREAKATAKREAEAEATQAQNALQSAQDAAESSTATEEQEFEAECAQIAKQADKAADEAKIECDRMMKYEEAMREALTNVSSCSASCFTRPAPSILFNATAHLPRRALSGRVGVR